ncbi:lipopolysaccharide biosynthesis protein [Pseudomonas soli]|uniref:lipopolysaccharide biosynthesis protein n=1 Tax=Pseudomonas soli TaxID=1306993 RepID=UPI0038282253
MSVSSILFSSKVVRLFNIALRGLTLLSKFALIFFLARFLEVTEVGVYGLFAAAIGYALYVVGFEFYNFSTREIIGQPPSRWLAMVRDQFALYSLLYAVFLPIALYLFHAGVLPWHYIVWFFLLTVLEHVAQEMNRLLVAISEPVLASVVLFVRSGAWCLVVVGWMWWSPGSRTLEFVFAAWLAGCFLACALAGLRLMRLDRSALAQAVDWAWVRKGVRVAIPLLVATLAVRGIFTLDRYFVEALANLSTVGAYVLYVSMATAVMSFLDAGVIVFLFPRLVALAKQGDQPGFSKAMRELTINVIVVTGVLVVACSLFARPVVEYLGSPAYMDHLAMLDWLLLAMALYCLSMIPHLGLYAHGRDQHLLWSQLAGFVLFILLAWLWGGHAGARAIPWAMCVAFGVVWVWKMVAYHLLCGSGAAGKGPGVEQVQ